MTAVVSRFATSQERIDILDGLLRYRNQIYAAGITSGYQWLDGSFTEDVEVSENRFPNDIDVVTYFEVPAGETQRTLMAKAPNVFDLAHLKAQFKVDGYFQILGEPLQEVGVRRVAYWYSMWSHRRDGSWKGFLQVSLDPQGDGLAQADLVSLQNNLGNAGP